MKFAITLIIVIGSSIIAVNSMNANSDGSTASGDNHETSDHVDVAARIDAKTAQIRERLHLPAQRIFRRLPKWSGRAKWIIGSLERFLQEWRGSSFPNSEYADGNCEKLRSSVWNEFNQPNMATANEMNLDEYSEIVTSDKLFVAAFRQNSTSIIGDDYDPLMHGRVFKHLMSIASEVIFFGDCSQVSIELSEVSANAITKERAQLKLKAPEVLISHRNILNFGASGHAAFSIVIPSSNIENVIDILRIADYIARCEAIGTLKRKAGGVAICKSLKRSSSGTEICAICRRSLGPKFIYWTASNDILSSMIHRLGEYKPNFLR